MRHLCTIAIWAALATAPASAEIQDFVHAEAGIRGAYPGWFIPNPVPNGLNSQNFVDLRGDAEMRIWVQSDPSDGFAAYRRAQAAEFQRDGTEIIYATATGDEFTFVGELGSLIVYLQVNRVITCTGRPVLAHMQVYYLASARDRIDPVLPELGNAMGAAPC